MLQERIKRLDGGISSLRSRLQAQGLVAALPSMPASPALKSVVPGSRGVFRAIGAGLLSVFAEILGTLLIFGLPMLLGSLIAWVMGIFS